MKHFFGIAIFMAGSAVFAQDLPTDDPVAKIKAQRALSSAHDLPPVPRGLVEPPPLPPPQMHTHDIRKPRKGQASANSRPRSTTPAKKPGTASNQPKNASAKPASTQNKNTSVKPASTQNKSVPAKTAAKPAGSSSASNPAASKAAPAKKPGATNTQNKTTSTGSTANKTVKK